MFGAAVAEQRDGGLVAERQVYLAHVGVTAVVVGDFVPAVEHGSLNFNLVVELVRKQCADL